MAGFLKIVLSRSIFFNSLKIAFVVGTLLNGINQGKNILGGGALAWWDILLNYLVPFCVASYSAGKTALKNR
ncbi:hypothetical protein EH222_14470 [candidate division KSB1 bacterium]|nr:MAG: hypothetical protein EH222_14470 [candidate division KSB1 bacterium]